MHGQLHVLMSYSRCLGRAVREQDFSKNILFPDRNFPITLSTLIQQPTREDSGFVSHMESMSPELQSVCFFSIVTIDGSLDPLDCFFVFASLRCAS